MSHAVNHYTTLGITKAATAEEVRDAYLLHARGNHPDAGGDTATFQRITEAYSVLRVPTKRAHYDRECALLFPQCDYCAGMGTVSKARGTRGVVVSTCNACNGSGMATVMCHE